MSDASLRRAALRLAALAQADRDWILAQLPHEDSSGLRGLIDDIRCNGFFLDTSVLEVVLSEPESVSGHDDISALLQSLGKPVWRTLLVQSLDDAGRAKWQAGLMAESPFVYRQLFSEKAFTRIPSAWSGALKAYAARTVVR